MKRHGTVAIVFAIAACCCGTRARTPEAVSQLPIFAGYGDLTWNRIVPDLGTRSPEIAILRVDPTTQATQLMIRTPAAIHVRKHWHSANETHTIIRGSAILECDGHRAELGPGSFNFMPAKDGPRGLAPRGLRHLHHRRSRLGHQLGGRGAHGGGSGHGAAAGSLTSSRVQDSNTTTLRAAVPRRSAS